MTELPDRAKESKRDDHSAQSRYASIAKPLFDRVLGIVLAVTTLPIVVASWLAVFVAVGRPAVVRSRRVGAHGAAFDAFELKRYEPARGRHEWRALLGLVVTRLGLHKVPLLWNVAAGHMSFIGPRPISPQEDAELADWERARHAVKPGLIGLWQVEGRRSGNVMENIHYDIRYVEQVSLSTDLRILGKAVASRLGLFGRAQRRHRPRLRDRIHHLRLMVTDSGLWLAALVLGVLVRFDFSLGQTDLRLVLAAFGLAVAFQLAFGLVAGLYRGKWSLGSFEESLWVGAGTVSVVALVAMVSMFTDPRPVPTGALVAAGAFHLLAALGARQAARVVYLNQRRSIHSRPHRLLVFGASDAGVASVEAIWKDKSSGFEPVAFLDDDPSKRGARILGLTVVGDRHELHAASQRYDADSLLVALTTASRASVEEIARIGHQLGLKVQVLPPVVDSLADLLVDHAQRTPTPTTYQRTLREASADRSRGRERNREFDLAIIGLGYVGLPVAVEATRVGVRVLGLDIDPDRVASLNGGFSYVEDVSSESLRAAIDAGFAATTDATMLELADAILISVPTPLREELPDLSAVIAAAQAIGDVLQPGQLVILESTTYPGTTEEVVQPILEQRSGLKAGEHFYLAYSPERIDPGNPTWGIHNTPKLVGGIDAESTEQAAVLYQKLCPVVTMSGPKEAEMAKLLENTYRHINIALVNELAIFCEQLGVDIWETIRGAATKPFGFQAFYPGPGVGGHCIPIDPNYLSYRVRELGEQFRFIELAQEINDYMPQYVAGRALQLLERSSVAPDNATILLLGVAYKPNVSDTRETPATEVGRQLLLAGVDVEFVDPHVESFVIDGVALRRRGDALEAAGAADLVIVHTPHDAISVEAICNVAKGVLDTRGITRGSNVERL